MFEFRLVGVMPYVRVWSSMTEEIAAAPDPAPPETRGRWRFSTGWPEHPIDAWLNLRVYFYAAAEYDVGSMSSADLTPLPDLFEEPKTFEFDVRNYFGQGHFLDAACLRAFHDGRHPLAQIYFWERICRDEELARLVFDVAEVLGPEVAMFRRRVFIRLQCAAGRHRSVASACSLAKIFALIFGVRTECFAYDAPSWRGRHQTRFCDCGDCGRGPNWFPPRRLQLLLRRSIAESLAERTQQSDGVQSDVWAALLAAVD